MISSGIARQAAPTSIAGGVASALKTPGTDNHFGLVQRRLPGKINAPRTRGGLHPMVTKGTDAEQPRRDQSLMLFHGAPSLRDRNKRVAPKMSTYENIVNMFVDGVTPKSVNIGNKTGPYLSCAFQSRQRPIGRWQSALADELLKVDLTLVLHLEGVFWAFATG